MLIDRKTSLGKTLFDDNKINIQSELLIGLVQALMILGNELGPAKGELREAELGKYQISILSKDRLAYVILQDTYDSEPFTRRMLEGILVEFHDIFMSLNFNLIIPEEENYKIRVEELLQSMKFPIHLMPEVERKIEIFNDQTNNICDALFIADLDDGIIKIFTEPTDVGIIKILMEILSEIPFERHWVGESKLRTPIHIDKEIKTHEGWFIYRIGNTDFCLLGRSFYAYKERDIIIDAIEVLSESILSVLKEDGSVFSKK